MSDEEVNAPEPEPVDALEDAKTVAEVPEVKALEEQLRMMKKELRETKQELRAVQHQFHDAQRLFFEVKDLCEKKDTFYEERATRDDELLEKALEHAEAFAALHEANVEAQDGVEKPWYDGDGDSPEGLFSLLGDFPQCDWADGGAGDVSETSFNPSDREDDGEDTAEEDADEKLLAESVERTSAASSE